MMRKVAALALVVSAAALLSACGGGGNSLLNRDRPDEMAVTRAAPLVVPPDFSLTPPNPGSPRPQDTDTGRQALDALFGGPLSRALGVPRSRAREIALESMLSHGIGKRG